MHADIVAAKLIDELREDAPVDWGARSVRRRPNAAEGAIVQVEV
jgi:hypothetical protein